MGHPPRALPGIDEAVVETAGATLPELDRLGDKAEPAPMGRYRDLPLGESPLGGLELALEVGAIADGPALVGGPGAQLAVAGAGMEIGAGLIGGHRLDPAADVDLSLEVDPGEGQRGARAGGEVASLPPGPKTAKRAPE